MMVSDEQCLAGERTCTSPVTTTVAEIVTTTTPIPSVQCGNGTISRQCADDSDQCIPVCLSGYTMMVSDEQCLAGERTCTICPKNSWCGVNTTTVCPYSFKSPVASTAASACKCHPGYMLNGSKCIECPADSFCAESMKHTCPTGTASNSYSKVETDCYCRDDYTGNIECATRSNTKKLPCNPGYAQSTSAKESKKWGCDLCPDGSWCDGEIQTTCPDGMTTEAGNHDKEACSCYTGYKRSQCTSVLTFKTTLEMTAAEFNAGKRKAYSNTIATFMKVPSTSITVKIVTNGASRRLLATTIEVENHITIPEALKDTIKKSYDTVELKKALVGASFAVTHISTASLSSTKPGTPTSTDTPIGVIIGVSAGAIIVIGVIIMICLRQKASQEYAPIGEVRQVVPKDVPTPDGDVQEAAMMTVSLKTDGFMKRFEHMV